MSLRFKLISIIALLLCIPFIAMLYLWQVNTSRTIERTATDYGQLLIRQTSSIVDTYFEGLERDTTPLLVLKPLQAFMNLEIDNSFEYISLTREIDQELQRSSLMRRSDFGSISLVASNGLTRFNRFSAEEYERALSLRVSDRTSAIGGVMRYGELQIPALAYYRYYSTYVAGKNNSVIAVYLDLSQIEQISGNISLHKMGSLAIVDQLGNYVYHQNRDLLGTAAEGLLTPDYPLEEEWVSIDNRGNDRSLIIQQRSPYTQWLYIYEVPLSLIAGELLQMQQLTVYVMIALMAIVLIIIGGYIYALTRRITLLQLLMRKAEQGNWLVEAPVQSKDELGSLNSSFNHMVVEIRRLLQQLRESHEKEQLMQARQRQVAIQAMQSQLHPHFLNNTLTVIDQYAIQENVQPISAMAQSLAQMFKYSVGEAHIVSLAEELAHINWYSSILKERDERLTISIEVDPDEVKNVSSVRLTLQPIVENAFQYSSDQTSSDPVVIRITGSSLAREGSASTRGYELRIADNGPGMSAEQIEAFNRQFQSMELEGREKRKSGRGIGLSNVHRRIRLTYGEPYGVSFAAGEACGLVVSVYYPYFSQNSDQK